MIAHMKKIEVFAMKSQRMAVMEALQRMESVQIIEDKNLQELSGVSMKEKIQQFEHYMLQAECALEILESISPEKKNIFSEKPEISMDNYSICKKSVDKINKVIFNITENNKKIKELTAKITQRKVLISELEPWKRLDIEMNLSRLKNAEFALYTLNAEVTPERMEAVFDDVRGVYYEIISAEKDLSCVWLAFLKQEAQNVQKRIKEAGFIQQTALTEKVPEEKLGMLKSEIKEISEEIKRLKEELKSLCNKRDDIKLLYDCMKIRIEKYENIELLKETNKTFILTGYISEDKISEVTEKLENENIYVRISEPDTEEEPPVLFKNNGFARPVEEITSTYSMPSKKDIDPNGIMAFFYYLFFGMMFSDAGYGIMVMLGAWYLGKKYNSERMRMFFFCGISTTFWGFMYGSFFGDLIYRFSITFLGKKLTLAPIWIDPAKEPLMLLIFSILLGLIQILTGLCINFYMNWRSGEKETAVYDTGAWVFIIFGAILSVIGITLNILTAEKIGIGFCVLGMLMVILMKGRENKNIVKRLFSGILGLYNITSYASDALSYSRLMALGLATGVIAQVVNIMGTLSGKSVLSFIIFISIFTVGHMLNFAINMLGAYVHTNRLQYVEFYSRFYEGGGKVFKPMGINTRFYKFKV